MRFNTRRKISAKLLSNTMSKAKLVSDSYDDMDMSNSSDNASEFEDAAQNVENRKNNDYVNELEERQKYVQEFINKSFQHFKKGRQKYLDFGYIHNQDMNYYQETYTYNVDDGPMLGPIEDDVQGAASNDPDYDPDYDEEINRLLDEVDKEILQDHSNSPMDGDGNLKNDDDYTDPRREQYEDCYDEFPENIRHVGPLPNWYKKMLQTKIKETRSRLENLSNLVCYACASTGAHIKRIEQDHSTTFCKMDETRHPPLDKPWTNFWKFNCMIKCKEIDKPNHAHTADCESVLLEHVNTGVSTATKNVSRNEYPNFVMDAVELFQDFAIETTRNVPFLDSKEALDTVYEKPVWTEMKLRSNYKNELMIVVRGKGVTSLITKLKRYFDSGPGRTSNVISVFCINQKWSQKKSNFLPSYVTGIFKLRDKVGPISINYEPKTNMNFNSVEAIQLGKIIEDYAGLTRETTLLDIGCNFGVLSLMMSHKCDRVIGLNTMHFVNSEISQAEELKKFNNIHNVSFVGCDPKDVLTKCSSIIKRSITVAVLNLASPYGKSIHVMQALRDLPTIWRVILYGSFTKEFHRNISMLTSKDDLMGDHYFPMQGCILDKSPSIEDAFDIVILFERKSLVTPSLELLAPGPTLNIKNDFENYGSLNGQEAKPIIKLEKGFGKPDFRPKKFFGPKPFMKYRGRINKFRKFDSPMLPMDDEQTPENLQKKPKERSPTLPAVERKFDCSVLRQKPPSAPPAQNGKERAVYPSIRKELQVKELKRIFDSPYLPIPKEEKPATNRHRLPSPSAKEKSFDYSILRKEKQFDCSVLRKQDESGDERSPLPCPSLPIKNEFHKFNYPSPPRERYPSPPPPPTENSFIDASQIKNEKDADYPPLTTVKAEPMELCDDKEEGELSPEDDRIPAVPIKSKTLDPSYFVGFSEANYQNVPQPVIVKAEPADLDKTPDLPPCRVKTEPEDMQISPYSQDIQNMETPIHNCKALSDSTYSSPLAIATNFTTLDGYEFFVRANQSFIPFKSDPDATGQPNVAIKAEPGLDMDEEIKIIGEKKIAAQRSQQQQSLETKTRVKTVDEIIKTKNEPAMPNDDLRALIEQRKTIQRKLDRERETRCYKELHGRSPSPDLPRRYRRQLSPSPPPPLKKYNRSPSPSPPFRKYNRSPSPTHPTRNYNQSPSPSSRKYNRSPSPYRRRSPISSRRYKISPPSPARNWIKRERSRSRSPSIKRSRRSPPQSERRSRRSPSPTRFKREPLSPMSSRWREKSRSSPSSSSSHKSYNKSDIHRPSKSPVKSCHDRRRRRSRLRSPDKVKRKRLSLSPKTPWLSVSPSPPRKRDASKERDSLKKKKKKTKSESKSKSPSRASKKKSKTIKEDDSHWDIPVLSTLSSAPNSSEHVEAATESVPSEPTESLKQEPVTSSSKSPSPIPQSEDVEVEVAAE